MGQIIVDNVVAQHLVLFDDILPCFIRATVGQIEIYNVVVLQALVFLLTMLETFLARSAPRAPDVQQDDFPFVRLDEFAQDLFSIAHIRHIFG